VATDSWVIRLRHRLAVGAGPATLGTDTVLIIIPAAGEGS
jgi:hypothetical protein